MRQIFEIRGGLVTCSSCHVRPTTRVQSHRCLGMYPRKVSSAWTEVWSIPWPSTAPITAPGGRDMEHFRASRRAGDIQFSPSKANYIDKIISLPRNIYNERF